MAENIQFKEDKTVVYEVPKKQYNEKKKTKSIKKFENFKIVM